MKGLFIFLITICILFFIVKLVLSILYRIKKDKYYNNLVVKYLNDYTIIAYIVLLYAFSISLYLTNDYNIEESNFTLIILSVAMVLFLGEKVYLSVKNRGIMYIESNIYDLKSLSLKEEYQNVLVANNKTDFVLKDNEKFDELLQLEEVCGDKYKNKKLASICIFNSLGILLCIAILVTCFVRGV